MNENLPDSAWGLIANSYGGNWDLATPEWREAAIRLRDRWLRRDDGFFVSSSVSSSIETLHLHDPPAEPVSAQE